ncbi:MAG TPA: SulP family inorganic anion transporter [Solirubrobacteraceae bacterium]|nr:SulP family inorganic anion transporter [Solirubrobacteraceae bacterium]
MHQINRVIRPPLVAIVVLTLVTVLGHMHAVPTVGETGALPSSLPLLRLPSVPLSTHTLSLIALPAVTMAIVGLLETQMTARRVDELTDTGSDKDRESVGQGVANVVSGLFGSMGGCAMIGQTMINVGAGARTRVSTFLAGAFLLVLCIALRPIVSEIPMAALVAVMFVVSYSTFDWESIKPAHLRRMPGSETTVMIVTGVLTVITGNLSIGVIAGVVVAALLFARRVQDLTTVTRVGPTPRRELHLHLPHLPHLHWPVPEHAADMQAHDLSRAQMTSVVDPDHESAIYAVAGELFFASTSDLADHFQYAEDPAHVIIDLSAAHIWDASSVAVLDRVIARYAHRGKTVELVGLNDVSGRLHDRLAGSLATRH